MQIWQDEEEAARKNMAAVVVSVQWMMPEEWQQRLGYSVLCHEF